MNITFLEFLYLWPDLQEPIELHSGLPWLPFSITFQHHLHPANQEEENKKKLTSKQTE